MVIYICHSIGYCGGCLKKYKKTQFLPSGILKFSSGDDTLYMLKQQKTVSSYRRWTGYINNWRPEFTKKELMSDLIVTAAKYG